MRYLNIGNDKLPALGLGTWKSKPGEVHDAIITAVKLGYRHIDCAAIYNNEKEIGDAFKRLISSGVVKREELWITSKLWNNSHLKQDLRPALEKTLADLQLDYLDLYLMHWPIANKPDKLGVKSADDYLTLEEAPLATTWVAMNECKSDGLARHIGVSNFSISKIDALIGETGIVPEANQVELHPYLQQKALVDYCLSKGIHVTAYSPLGSGDRSAFMKDADEPNMMADETIIAMAKKYDASPAQILLAWSVCRGTSVIPKSVNPERLAANLRAADIALSAHDMDTIATLDRHYRFITGKFIEVPDGYYTTDWLWQ